MNLENNWMIFLKFLYPIMYKNNHIFVYCSQFTVLSVASGACMARFKNQIFESSKFACIAEFLEYP